jgi:nucleolar protein 15
MSKVLQQLASSRIREEEESNDAIVAKKATGKGGKKRAIEETKEPTKAQLSLQLRPVSKGKKETTTEVVVPSSSVIYLGHIPKGFFEAEMRKFFSQFGGVKRLKLFRSRKTNNSKGYAFVEFESPDVAKVVAEAMDGYFLSDRKLKAHVIAPEKIHDGMFKFYHRQEEESSDDEDDAEKEKKGSEDVTEENIAALLAKREKAMQKKLKKLQELGIEYTIPQIAGSETIEKETKKTTTKNTKKTKASEEAEKVVTEAAPEPVESTKPKKKKAKTTA